MSDEEHNAEQEPAVMPSPNIQGTPPDRKPARRSPTTGHRKKKQEIKRSHSSPREKLEASSEEEDKLVRRNSLEEKPKKTIRRRVKAKTEKTEESSKESESKDEKNEIEETEPEANQSTEPEEKTPKEMTPPPTESTPDTSSWWTKWIPSWSQKSEQLEEKIQDKVEDISEEEPPEDLTSEFISLVSQTENKLLAEIESQIVKEVEIKPEKIEEPEESPPPPTWSSFSQFIQDTKIKFKKYKEEFPQEVEILKKLRNRCISELVIMIIFCGLGALIFKFVEGAFESFYKCGVKRVKRDFIDELWRGSHHLREDEWKSKARRKLMEFENQLHEAFDAGMTTYSGRKSWSFINAIIYCLTVVTTIGYGHIAPVTTTGRALTIAYSIIGIPLFLLLLADFGKLFTRSIKFLWAFVRRLYYTGSCKKVRRTAPVQEVMKGVQMVYDMALLRRPSQMQVDAEGNQIQPPMTPISPGEAPSTPALSAFAVDDEFNLPITVAIVILLIYIFMGAAVFYVWETDWTFFDSFYFVFISMSTIGFGDLVPANQMYMMASIVYLAFGLALTSMCINVVQEKLSDTFRQASAKIGATIGLKVSEDDGTIEPASPTHVEIAEVHKAPSPTT